MENTDKILCVGKYKHVCEKCGIEFYSQKKKRRFCSNKCYLNRNLSFDECGNKTLKCSICKQYKLLTVEYFHHSNATTFGFMCFCKSCSSIKSSSPEKLLQRRINRARPHNVIKISNYGKKQRSDPEFKKNRNLTESLRKKEDPAFCLKTRMRILMYASIRKTKNGRKWEELAGYTVNELRNHIGKLFTEGMDWDKFANGEIHIDHKLPVSHFNFTSPEDNDFKKCWALDNLQPMLAIDNIKKSNKLY